MAQQCKFAQDTCTYRWRITAGSENLAGAENRPGPADAWQARQRYDNIGNTWLTGSNSNSGTGSFSGTSSNRSTVELLCSPQHVMLPSIFTPQAALSEALICENMPGIISGTCLPQQRTVWSIAIPQVKKSVAVSWMKTTCTKNKNTRINLKKGKKTWSILEKSVEGTVHVHHWGHPCRRCHRCPSTAPALQRLLPVYKRLHEKWCKY